MANYKAAKKLDEDALSGSITKLIDDFTENSISQEMPEWNSKVNENLILKTLVIGMAIAAPTYLSSDPYIQINQPRHNRRLRDYDFEEEQEIKRIYNKILNEISRSDEIFEDGKISRLAHEMLILYTEDNGAAILALNDILKGLRRADQPKAAEILKWLGYLAASNNDTSLIWVLLNASKSSSDYIRDAAALALIDYSSKIPSDTIGSLIKNEKIDYIKETLEYAYSRSVNEESDS